jgi:hypothetical protein
VKKRNTSPDWAAIEKAYRLGQLSIREIARQHDVDVSAISRKAKSLAWTRDYTEEVRRGVNTKLLSSTPEATVPTREDIEKAQNDAASVVRAHRKSLTNGQRITAALFDQLEDAAKNRQTIAEMIDSEDLTSARAAAMKKAISIPQHAATLRDLSTALKNFQAMERIAWNLNQGDDGEEGDDKNLTLAIGFVKANG